MGEKNRQQYNKINKAGKKAVTTENQKKKSMCRLYPLVLSACCISIVSVNEVPGCQ